MQQHDYQSSITADIPPEEACEKISRMNEWWSTHVEGNSTKLGDVFTVNANRQMTHFSKLEMTHPHAI